MLYLEELLNTYSDGASCLVECLVANKTGMILDGNLIGKLWIDEESDDDDDNDDDDDDEKPWMEKSNSSMNFWKENL